jgi:hypothetical protein
MTAAAYQIAGMVAGSNCFYQPSMTQRVTAGGCWGQAESLKHTMAVNENTMAVKQPHVQLPLGLCNAHSI